MLFYRGLHCAHSKPLSVAKEHLKNVLFSQSTDAHARLFECDERDHHTHRAKTDTSMEPLSVRLAHGTLAAHIRMVVSYYVALWHAPASSAHFFIYLILESMLPGINFL